MDARFEPRGAPRPRIPAVGADRKPGRDDAPVFESRSDGVGGKIVSLHPSRGALDACHLRDSGRKRLGHPVIFDIPAEGVEPDFRGVELDWPRRKQGSAIIDEAQ